MTTRTPYRRTYRRRPPVDGMQFLGFAAIVFGVGMLAWIILHYAMHVL
ncbi:hypothetical protein [Ktedonospora formicarum]|uniref:Uncharacterized protein n=1 Tax=Ktedonospora formicarum TaxID=2778364 RepID=A0A8J3N040_9CHLR|nr:hypothetical protein [Ktedonospora formicarum]GHO51425.1 hypothetical protein KSX_95880 [Ktedonospora formicarum]